MLANAEATLNQLLQNLKISGSSATSSTGAAAATAQSSGQASQQHLMSMLQRFAQQLAPASIGSMVSATA
jgi:hypothetical protein